jgi:hypothetical protein
VIGISAHIRILPESQNIILHLPTYTRDLATLRRAQLGNKQYNAFYLMFSQPHFIVLKLTVRSLYINLNLTFPLALLTNLAPYSIYC